MSPILRRNMMDAAVPKSPVSIAAVIDVASSTGTSILPFIRHFSPLRMYLNERTIVMYLSIFRGSRNRLTIRPASAARSLFSNSRFSARPVFAGTSALALSRSKRNFAILSMRFALLQV